MVHKHRHGNVQAAIELNAGHAIAQASNHLPHGFCGMRLHLQHRLLKPLQALRRN